MYNKILKEKAEKMYDITRYILSSILEQEEVDSIINEYKWKGGESIMTARECWIRELNQEKRECEKKGIEKGISKIVKKMLSENMIIEDICKFTGLTKEEVNKIKVS